MEGNGRTPIPEEEAKLLRHMLRTFKAEGGLEKGVRELFPEDFDKQLRKQTFCCSANFHHRPGSRDPSDAKVEDFVQMNALRLDNFERQFSISFSTSQDIVPDRF